MACNEPAQSGRHNCRKCSGSSVQCFIHKLQSRGINILFSGMVRKSYEDTEATAPGERWAELRTLHETALAGMLERGGPMPLDSRPQAIIDQAAKVARY